MHGARDGCRRARPPGGGSRRSGRAPRSTRSTSPTAGRPARARRNCRTTTSSPSTRMRPCCITRCWTAARPAGVKSFLIDAGAQHAGYACDITRTYAADAGRVPGPDPLGRRGAAEARRPRAAGRRLPRHPPRGAPLDRRRCWSITRHRVGFGRRRRSRSGVTSVFFPHGIGHLLGIMVHDAGGLRGGRRRAARATKPEGHPYLRLTRDLEPGFVVTIEPGIYFIDSLLDAGARGRARARDRLEAGGCAPPLRRHPHRGQRASRRPARRETSRARRSRRLRRDPASALLAQQVADLGQQHLARRGGSAAAAAAGGRLLQAVDRLQRHEDRGRDDQEVHAAPG